MLRTRSWLFVLLFAFFALAVQAQTVDINSASAQELQSVKGIGPKKAEAIVKYRTEHGAFQSVDDLVNVPGIGPKSLNSMRDQLSVGGATSGLPSGGARTPMTGGTGARLPSGGATTPGGLTTPPPGSRYAAPGTMTPPAGAKPQQQ